MARAGYAATPAVDAPAAAPATSILGEARRDAGKSFQEHARISNAEEPSYSIPENFPGLAAPPPREPATGTMLLASFGLMLYLGSRRQKALAIVD